MFGRYISKNDVDMKTNVAVINNTTAVKIFGKSGEDVLDEKIRLKTWKGTGKFTLIGIMENSNASADINTAMSFQRLSSHLFQAP